MAPPTDPLAIVSITLGVLSAVTCACCAAFGIPLSIAAVICGGVSLSRQRDDPDRFGEMSKPLAITGVVMGTVFLLVSILTTSLSLLANFGDYPAF